MSYSNCVLKEGNKMKKLSMMIATACMATTLVTAVPLHAAANTTVTTQETGENSEVVTGTKKLSVKYVTKKYEKKVTVKKGSKKVKKTAVKSTFSYPVIANADAAAKKIQAHFDKELILPT